MSMKICVLILLMALVTYIPRALPVLLVDKAKMNRRMELFLEYIPYAALGALVFPGILNVDAEHIPLAVIAAAIAFALSIKKENMILTIFVTTGAYIIMQLLFPFLL